MDYGIETRLRQLQDGIEALELIKTAIATAADPNVADLQRRTAAERVEGLVVNAIACFERLKQPIAGGQDG